MKRNTAVQLLRLLSEEEIRKLGKFLRSPYFNYSKPTIALFEQLRKWHPEYEEKRIRPHIFWKKLYPGKDFSEQKYWTLNFQLRCLIERFMAVEQLESDEFEFKRQLIKSHSQRNAHASFEKETKNLVEQIEQQPWQDIYSYSKLLWLKHDYFFNPLTDKYGGAIYAVEDAMEELDKFYLLTKLRFASEMKNRERIFSKKIPINLLSESILESEKYEENNTAFSMYKNVLDLYDTEKAGAAFAKGKKLLEDKFSKLSKHDQNEVMLNLRNYAIRQLNTGKTEYWKEIFELYKMGLELDLIVSEGKISEAAFGNIVHAGCIEKQYEWTEEFINKYSTYLDQQIREDTKLLSFGILYFQKQEYDKALDYIENQNFSNTLHQGDVRILSSKIWFEKFIEKDELYEMLISRLNANEKYFRRHSFFNEDRKVGYINFFLAAKMLAEMKYGNLDKNVIKDKMNKYINEKEIIFSRSWLVSII